MDPSAPSAELLHQRLAFLRATEPFKDTLRSAFTATGRQESAAAHSWRLCLMVLILLSMRVPSILVVGKHNAYL